MSDYPDPDEEFELMYGDDYDLLRSQAELTQSTPKVPQAAGEFQQTQESTTGRKRSINELFGDINDIEDIDDNREARFREILLPKPKKLKTNNDENIEKLALIEYILELRKDAQENFNSSNRKSISTQQTLHKDDLLNNVSTRVPKYPFTVLTSTEGERIYIRTHSEKYWKDEVKNVSQVVNFGSGLVAGPLGSDFDEIWEQAHENIVNKSDANEVVVAPSFTPAKGLWVEVYKPTKYIDLLSDEAINRTLLKWIKLWDRIVFNRRVKTASNLTQFQRNFLEVEPDHRPKYKIVLLAGPPGLGKTTLAHMIAHHAGYKPLEVNASDDRSPDVFKKVLDTATTMTSVLDRERRPNCVIFDEIDGAPTQAIEYLCKYVQGSIKQKTKVKSKSDEEGKKDIMKVLKRPIIAICNDAYVPALRVLRQMALVLHVPAINASRLTQRLIEISLKEKIKISRHALTTLAEKSNCDIRNCLSLLQFFKVQNDNMSGHNSVALEQILNISHSKDVHKGLFQLWSDIFHLTRNKDNTFPTPEERSQRIQEASHNFDFDKLSTGIFENYVRLSSVKDNMNNTKKALDWFSYMDVLNKKIVQTQDYQLAGYLTWGFVQWHFQFGNIPNSHNQRVFPKTFQNAKNSGAKPIGSKSRGPDATTFANNDNNKIIFPTASTEVRSQAQKTEATYSDILKHMCPQVRSHNTKNTLALDILPMLSYIINPNLRPVNLHLYTQKEKDEMARVVCIMIDYGLNYIQERTVEGTYAFNLDPNIEELCKYSTSKGNSVKSLSYSNRQLVAREIELEKMRRLELIKHKNVIDRVRTDQPNLKINIPLATANKNAQVPNHLAKLTPKKIDLNPTKSKKFFSFVKTDNSTTDESSTKGGFGNGIYFQFKEGHTNAVKRTIKISSLHYN